MELKTIEEWKKICLPQPSDPIRGWARGEEFNKSKDWLFNSAKILFKWAVGEEMSKEQFEDCLEQASKHFQR